MKKRILSFLSAVLARFGNVLFWAVFAVLTLEALWCVGAFFHAFNIPRWMAWVGLLALLTLLAASIFRRWFLPAAAILEIAVLAAYLCITPERRFRETRWQTPWQRTLEVRPLADGRYELANVRDFLYHSENEFDVRYRTMTVDPEQISSIDAVFSHWDDLEGVAHSMLGLNFADGQTVVISLETRLPAGAVQNGLDGFYRRYGLAMLAGTPEDLYGLRTDHRGETLYVYRLKAEHEALHSDVLSIFARAAELQRHPTFYNSLFRNCTTGLLPMLSGADERLQGDLRVMLNGLAAKMLFEKDLIVRREGESFGSLRARSLVPGRCRGKDAPPAVYAGESETRWLHDR